MKPLYTFRNPQIVDKLDREARKTEAALVQEVRRPDIPIQEERVYVVKLKEALPKYSQGILGRCKAYIQQRKRTNDSLEFWLHPAAPSTLIEVDVFNLWDIDFAEGTILLAIQDRDGDLYVVRPAPTGKIGFRLLTNRTREAAAGSGLLFGRAQAVIQDIVGVVPHNIGDTVEVRFFGRLWLGAVIGCQGTAEFYQTNELYIIDECQTLAAWIRFETLVNRNPYTVNEQVPATILGIVAAATSYGGGLDNATYPPQDYLSQSSNNNNNNNQGSSLWVKVQNGWSLVSHSCGPGSTPEPPQWWPQTIKIGDTMPGTCSVPNNNQGGAVTVQYDDLEFPHAMAGAVGKALLDIDYGTEIGVPNMRYHVVESDQFSPMQRVYHGKFCPGAPAPVSQSESLFFFPFGQRPPPFASAYNMMNLASNGGDGVVVWDESYQQWIILQPMHEVLPLDRGLKESGCKLGVYQQEFSLMTCEDGAKWMCEPQSAAERYPPACIVLTEMGAVSDVALEWDTAGGCQLKLKAKTTGLCGFAASPNAQPPSWVDKGSASFAATWLVADVVDDGTCAYPVFVLAYLPPCGGSELDGDAFICITECPTGSGSGGSG